MTAIFKRELSAYFRSPIGYVFCAVYLFFSALYFRAVLLGRQSSEFPQIYYGMLSIILLILPVLTMRLFSEERRQKTDQILITSPVSIFSLVLGKFLSALTVYAGCTLFTLLYAVVFRIFTGVSPGWALVFGNVLGAILFGAAFIAVGMFISCLTESQVVAAIGTFFIATVFILLDVIPMLVTNEVVLSIIEWISFVGRYTPFTEGLLDFSSVIFFLSATALFIFLTMQSIERRRWE
ncbi:MAG: ABC transporter permease [Clostridia bacterium]|nr:ABC transporter permease [Clostridia bacterium]MBQ9993296.1 ABC transporter permease [Clostridia bacterium]